jgi:hypothetical protein
MKLVICVIIDKEVDSLLLVEQNLGRGYWFPFDEIKTGETRAIAAKRITSKVSFKFQLSIFFFLSFRI